MSPELLVAAAMVASLLVYVLTGGADFGGGVWDLLASGPRKAQQRTRIAKAIGPIWEANHVWLIVVVVLLFACFPEAYAALSIALHVPLTLMLFGIVLRGSAFAFRSFEPTGSPAAATWGRVFAISSVVTPLMLGICAATVSSGRLLAHPEGSFADRFIAPWLTLFPLSMGALTLALFAFLAAVYLVVEAGEDAALRADFHRRARLSLAVAAVLAILTLLAARDGAPELYAALTGGTLTRGVLLAGAASAAICGYLLETGRARAARLWAGAFASWVVLGWCLAQYPYLVLPQITIQTAAAPRAVLVPVLWALGAGALLLVPAFVYLFRVFKGAPPSIEELPQGNE